MNNATQKRNEKKKNSITNSECEARKMQYDQKSGRWSIRKKRENTSHMRVLQRALKNSSANRVCMCARVAFFFFFAQFIRCSASIYNIAPTANHRQENVCDETIR